MSAAEDDAPTAPAANAAPVAEEENSAAPAADAPVADTAPAADTAPEDPPGQATGSGEAGAPGNPPTTPGRPIDRADSPIDRADSPIDWTAAAWMLGLTLIWGLNAVSIKALTLGMAPIMGAALRGAIALALLTAYGWWRGESFRYSRGLLLHGAVAGCIFAVEGVLLYRGATYTSGGHVAIFINTAPFFVALGAHYLLPGDRLNRFKVAGLLLAFAGVLLLFSGEMEGPRAGYWRGDLLVMGAALMWASSTLYIKGVLGHRMTALRLMWIRILVSTVLLFAASLLTEADPLGRMDRAALVSLVFQGSVVVFFSYMMWVRLLQRYPASGLQAFTFLVPVWGVAMGGLMLGESLTWPMAAGMALVGAGLILVNKQRRGAVETTASAANTARGKS